MPLSSIGDSLYIHPRYKFVIYTRNHLRVATSTSSILGDLPSTATAAHSHVLRSCCFHIHPYVLGSRYDHHHECAIHHTVTLSIIF
jgi:hypothetical protein